MTTQSAKDFLEGEIDRKLKEADGLVTAAKNDNRSLSASEKSRMESLLSEASGLKARVDEIADNERLAESIEKMRGSMTAPAEERQGSKDAASFGDHFVKSDAFRTLQGAYKSGALTGNWSSGPVEMPNFFDAKATVTTTASPVIQPDVRDGILPFLYRRLTVADLLAPGTTDSGSVRYLREATNTNAAAAVLEGDLKPESTITFDQVDEPVRKIATFLPVSDEMLEDAAQLRSYLDERLRVFVQQQEEAQLLNGSGTAPNLRGLLQRTGIQTATRAALGTAAGNGAGASSLLDAVYMAITNVRNNALVEPDGIILHPSNWATIQLQKDAQANYMGGNPFDGAAGPQLWGMPVVVTSAIAQNTALVGAFRTSAQIFRRNGLTVEASNSHSDFFQRNLTAIRAEERLALAVYRPAALHAITALQTA